MTTDTDKLRQLANDIDREYLAGHDLIAAAADEIDRLRAELANQAEGHEAELAAQAMHRQADALVATAERDGLAATIKRVTDLADHWAKVRAVDCDYMDAGKTLRAALSTQDGETT